MVLKMMHHTKDTPAAAASACSFGPSSQHPQADTSLPGKHHTGMSGSLPTGRGTDEEPVATLTILKAVTGKVQVVWNTNRGVTIRCHPQDCDPSSAGLTKGDAQVARYKGKVGDLCWYPQHPQRFTGGPDLVTPFVVGMLHGVGPLLHNALHQEEGGEVQERVAAAIANSTVNGCQQAPCSQASGQQAPCSTAMGGITLSPEALL